MRWLASLLGALVLCGCAALPRPGSMAPSDTAASTGAQAATPPYEAWARVLDRFVDAQGRVDFAGVARDPADLERFVAYVFDVGPRTHPGSFPTADDVLAYHLNAYNALAMYKVVAEGIPHTLGGLRKLTFFYFSKVQVAGQAISLYEYENKVIRPLGDARVHVALNCMSVGCPRLPRTPFLPHTLQVQLDREARTFYNESRNVAVDPEARVLRLSEILDFYRGDFLAQAPSLAAYVNRYRVERVPEDYAVQFIPYDWTVFRQP